MNRFRAVWGNPAEAFAALEAETIDSILSDPLEVFPDISVGRGRWIKAALPTITESFRVLKPGGHCILRSFPSFASWVGTAAEEAGFEIRDSIAVLADGTGGLYWLARKPVAGNIAATILQYATGGLNINGCRTDSAGVKWETPRGGFWETDTAKKAAKIENDLGRWPANVILSSRNAETVDEQSGFTKSGVRDRRAEDSSRKLEYRYKRGTEPYDDAGGASRFYVTLPDHAPALTLYRYLARLITPPSGVLLDCFAVSGTPGSAALIEGFHTVAICPDYDALEAVCGAFTAALNGTAAPLKQGVKIEKPEPKQVVTLFSELD